MRYALALVLLLAGCELPPPELDSVGVSNPLCVLFCRSDYRNTSDNALPDTLTTTETSTAPQIGGQ